MLKLGKTHTNEAKDELRLDARDENGFRVQLWARLTGANVDGASLVFAGGCTTVAHPPIIALGMGRGLQFGDLAF